MEARGTHLRLLADGRLIAQGTVGDSLALDNARVGLYVSSADIAVSSFKVIYP
jgi:hypothetical protein